MMFFLFFLSILSIISCKNEDEQIINIRLNEELPLSTILFSTTNNTTYRFFDSGRNQNSFVFYNTSNSQIILVHSLDREYLCLQHICSCTQCQLIIELIEWQVPYRLLKLILNIEDINDHEPTFSSENYQLNIRENVPIGFELPLESAYDADLDENSRISYELTDFSQGPFQLVTKMNGGLGLKVIKEIDREERDFYQYELIAFDHGQPRQHSSTKLSIQIDDVNDNPVVLTETYIQLHVSENTPVGSELTFINATDRDIGLNGKIHYSISNGFTSDYFRIGESTGILTVTSPLDYEVEQFYRLTIQVRDLGENSLARFVTIDISILDENDNSPQAFVTFVNPPINNSIISILENTPIGQILAHISISDQDSGLNSQMSYEITQGDEFIGIKILDEKSFLLVINHLIDREDETIKSNKLILMISDHGKPSKSIKLEYDINIIDINDYSPRFNQSLKCNLHFNQSQNQSLEQFLFQIQAIDLDLGDNGLISYFILPPYNNSFIINNQGQVFNFENLNQSFYHLQIMAIDNGKIIRLNSTYDCYIKISTDDDLEYSNKSIPLIDNIIIFKYNYLLVIFALISLIIGIIFCLHHRRCFKQTKTYHLYVTIPRKSSYSYDENVCDRVSDEHENLVQFSQINRKNYPLFVMSTKSSPDSSNSLFKQDSRPVSLSISTATTCTSVETDSANSTIIRLAEEEQIDI